MKREHGVVFVRVASGREEDLIGEGACWPQSGETCRVDSPRSGREVTSTRLQPGGGWCDLRVRVAADSSAGRYADWLIARRVPPAGSRGLLFLGMLRTPFPMPL